MSFQYQPPAHAALDVVHADESLLVVNKPSGLLSVPGRGEGKQDCMASRVQAEFADALIVHRLDMATSGLLVMARGAAVHRQLSLLFQGREVDKRYLAVVAGRMAREGGEVDLPLVTDWPNRPRQKVDFDIGKPSLTRYRVLDYDASLDATRVELEPLTGRSHQLRVHMLSLGHPILGDDLYADDEVRARSPRLLLHAAFLAFRHPVTLAPLSFACPTPF
ncbi:MAG: RNA pseudouridine synthase [Zoogloea sp.]|nr:RNA pseudouridine synthase [Zoogloea sp.]